MSSVFFEEQRLFKAYCLQKVEPRHTLQSQTWGFVSAIKTWVKMELSQRNVLVSYFLLCLRGFVSDTLPTKTKQTSEFEKRSVKGLLRRGRNDPSLDWFSMKLVMTITLLVLIMFCCLGDIRMTKATHSLLCLELFLRFVLQLNSLHYTYRHIITKCCVGEVCALWGLFLF